VPAFYGADDLTTIESKGGEHFDELQNTKVIDVLYRVAFLGPDQCYFGTPQEHTVSGDPAHSEAGSPAHARSVASRKQSPSAGNRLCE
jgi:hypothetical protein